MSDWSGVPKDILESMFERLENDVMDCLSFSAVCTHWRLMAVEKGRHALPRIMMMFHDDKDDCSNMNNSFSLSTTNNLYENHLPDIKGKKCYGSLNGLLITVDRNSGAIHLLNPISGTLTYLPSPSVLEAEQLEFGPISKVNVSPIPNSDGDYAILAFRLASKRVYYCKKGDEKWTMCEIKYGGIMDVTCYKDNLYAIVTSGIIEVLDLQKPGFNKCIIKIRKPGFTVGQLRKLLRYFVDVKQLRIPNGYEGDGRFHTVYLVKTPDDELLMVLRYVLFSELRCDTVGFKVFELVGDFGDWNEVESLGDRVVFLGRNSVCLMAQDVPECRSNSIYCADSKDSNGLYAMGVFNMEAKRMESLYENHPFKHSSTTWFTPNLHARGV